MPWVLLSRPVFCDSHAVVEQIATTIERNYFDPGRGAAIGAALRDQVATGRFDSLTDGDLSSRLNLQLQKRDHHFLVTWSPASPLAPELPTYQHGAPPPDEFERRSAHGFHTVTMLPGAIGYIDLRAFVDFSDPEGQARRMADAALELLRNADALILDLRNNPGGSPDMVGYLVSAFTDPEADIYNVLHYRDRTESERPKVAYPQPRLDVPLYVLISGRTASAAESLAYTLQASRRATIVGEVSAGAANPGGAFPIGEGFSVFVSISTPVNPITHTNWDTVGVKPDIAVSAQQALTRAQGLALEAILSRPGDSFAALDARWALEALRAGQSRVPGPSLSEYLGDYEGARISLATTGDGLQLRRGRRPAWTLTRIHGDRFFVTDEPYRNVIFHRNRAGIVQRFQLLRVGGPSTWFTRIGVLPALRRPPSHATVGFSRDDKSATVGTTTSSALH
jgi:Peptidase family S41